MPTAQELREYRYVVREIENEHKRDLAIHLYSTLVLRTRSKFKFPSPGWASWPIDPERIPIPYCPETRHPDEIDEFPRFSASVPPEGEEGETVVDTADEMEKKVRNVRAERNLTLQLTNRPMFKDSSLSCAFVNSDEEDDAGDPSQMKEPNGNKIDEDEELQDLDDGDDDGFESSKEDFADLNQDSALKKANPRQTFQQSEERTRPDPTSVLAREIRAMFKRKIYSQLVRHNATDYVDFDSMKTPDWVIEHFTDRLDELFSRFQSSHAYNLASQHSWMDIYLELERIKRKSGVVTNFTDLLTKQERKELVELEEMFPSAELGDSEEPALSVDPLFAKLKSFFTEGLKQHVDQYEKDLKGHKDEAEDSDSEWETDDEHEKLKKNKDDGETKAEEPVVKKVHYRWQIRNRTRLLINIKEKILEGLLETEHGALDDTKANEENYLI